MDLRRESADEEDVEEFGGVVPVWLERGSV